MVFLPNHPSILLSYLSNTAGGSSVAMPGFGKLFCEKGTAVFCKEEWVLLISCDTELFNENWR